MLRNVLCLLVRLGRYPSLIKRDKNHFVGIMDHMKWNLNDILKIEEFDGLYAEIEKDLEQLKKYAYELDPKMSEEKFKELIEFNENFGDKISRLGGLPSLMLASNTKDQKARLMQTRAEDLGLKISEVGIKISHFLKGVGENSLDNENAQRLFKVFPDLEYSFNYARLAAKYTLKESEENIINNKDVNGISSVDELRKLISTEFKYEMLGKKINTQSELLTYVYSGKKEERKEAYEALLNKQKENIDKFFVIYQSVVKDWNYEAKLRGYKSPIAVRNFGNELDDETVETVIKVTRDNKNIFHRYFAIKAKEMGEDKLNRFDIYAPSNSVDVDMNYDEIQNLVIKTFTEFSPRFAKAAKQIIDKKHIDNMPDENKQGGAFCATINRNVDPYVMMNFTGKRRDVYTLAHELGHGVHSLYANKHFSSVQHAGLPLAETASTLGELALFEKLLETEGDKKAKKAMLMEKMGDLYATVLRQNYFTLFEKEAHQAIQKGVTEKELSGMYLDNLKDQFGESLDIPEIFKYEWSYVSHFFASPFYCYAYTFGQLLALSLYKEYKEDKDRTLKIIENILEAGGSQNPTKLLKQNGIDIKDTVFWQKGCDIIDTWVSELELL